MTIGSSSLSARDLCIRVPLMAWVKTLHQDGDSTRLIEEFKMPRPSARIDLAVVNGEMSGFEIKSDVDTLARLKRQATAYSMVFDKLTVVTTAKHLDAAIEMLPNWWGVVLFSQDEEFKVIREGQQNKSVDVRSLLYTLTKSEILAMADSIGAVLPKRAKKSELVEMVSTFNPKLLSDGTRAVLKERAPH